jgi:hypothetical protein
MIIKPNQLQPGDIITGAGIWVKWPLHGYVISVHTLEGTVYVGMFYGNRFRDDLVYHDGLYPDIEIVR